MVGTPAPALVVDGGHGLNGGQYLGLSIVSLCEHGEVPVKLPQLPPLPESQDKAQPGLKHTQGGLAHVIDQLVLAGSNDIGPP